MILKTFTGTEDAGLGLSGYWIRQAKGAERRAATWREKAKWHCDPKWCLNMARGAEKDYHNCFLKWRELNPQGPSTPFHVGLASIGNKVAK